MYLSSFPSFILSFVVFALRRGSSLIGVSPISLCFLLVFLSSIDPAEFIVLQLQGHLESCFFHYVVSFVQYFTLIREVLEGLWDLCLSFYFILDSRKALSLVTFFGDCLSIDRSLSCRSKSRVSQRTTPAQAIRKGCEGTCAARTHSFLLLFCCVLMQNPRPGPGNSIRVSGHPSQQHNRSSTPEQLIIRRCSLREKS